MKRFKPTLLKRQIESNRTPQPPDSRPSEEGSRDERSVMATPFVTFITKHAWFHAISLIRLGLFRWDELEDLSQDLLLDLLQRFSRSAVPQWAVFLCSTCDGEPHQRPLGEKVSA